MCTCQVDTSHSEGWYARLFAKFYDRMLYETEQRVLLPHRKTLIEPLHGEVLEIGCGTGVNFSLYGSKAKVTAIEPSRSMLVQAQAKAAESGAKIKLTQMGVEDLPDHQKYDAVVTTLVLCTVPDLDSGLNKIVGLLKKGGRLCVLEHIRSHKPLGATFQAVLRPAWKVCGQGCILNRPTDQFLKKTPELRLLHEEYFRSTLPFFVGIFEKRSSRPS